MSQRRVASQQFYAVMLDLVIISGRSPLTIYCMFSTLLCQVFVRLRSSTADNTTKGSKVFAGVRTSVPFSDTSKILLNKPLQTLI